MGGLRELEVAILQRLSLLRCGAAGAFRDLVGDAGSGTGRLLEAMAHRSKPAGMLRYAGRRSVAGRPVVEFVLYVGVEGLRGGQEARLGGTGVVGAHPLLDLVRVSLDGCIPLTGHRLRFTSETCVAGDERTVVYQQTYQVEEVL